MKNTRIANWTAISVWLCSLCYTAPGQTQTTLKLPAASISLKKGPGYLTVLQECTVCHSEKLIAQNRATRAGWIETIRWMQKTQNLREFSAEEERTILDYLASHYAPRSIGRRPPLNIQEWYEFKP